MPLKHIPKVISPDLLHALASMGHGDEIGTSHLLHSEIIYFVSTKFRGLMTMDMFVDIGICGFQITCIFNITKVNKYFVGILNSWIVLPTKYTKLNVQ